MKLTFFLFKKIDIGLLFERLVKTPYADSLNTLTDLIKEVKEDSSGRLRIETEKHVYIEEGFQENS